jgi:cbb3-type cytochrome oxidase maturation protein
MNILILLIIVSLIVALTFLGLFIWSVKSGQYNDTDSPAMRILYEDKPNATRTKHDADHK